MTVAASTVSSLIQLTKYRLVERVAYEGYVLSVVLRAMPENIAWQIKFSGVVGFRVFDERDLLKYWPACSGGALFQIHEGGWLPEAKQYADHLNFGFYGEVAEYLVAGEDSCVNVISSELPTVEAFG
jgi:hypothetical protein